MLSGIINILKWAMVFTVRMTVSHEKLLTNPSMRDSAHKVLCSAAGYGHLELVDTLLTFPVVRDNAHTNDNEALRLAVENRHFEVVKRLLGISGVKANAYVKNNCVLYCAAAYKHLDIVSTLLKISSVQQDLLSNEEVNLVTFFRAFPDCRSTMIENLSIYGLSLSRLFQDVAESKQLAVLEDYFNDPISYLENQKAPTSTIEAVRIIYTAQLVEDDKRYQAEMERNREHFKNVDDEARIDAIRKHYNMVIKPYFQAQFEEQGNNDTERLCHIEMGIRELFLNRMKQEAQEKERNDENAARVIAFINSLDEESKQRLLRGNDRDLMTTARSVFSNIESEAQTAWRAYDAEAPVGGQWPNLLTAPLANPKQGVYTVNTVGLENPTTQMASDLAREMMAYSYLLVTDKNDGSEEDRMLRETTFIAKISEIRRSHNNGLLGVDDPSCLPGTVSRAGDTWIAHRKSVIPDAPKLLEEELRSLILEQFQRIPEAEQDAIYHALVMLSNYNALDIIAQRVEMPESALYLRQQFKDKLGNYPQLKQTLDNALQTRGSRVLSEVEFNLYVPALLANIGGAWSVQQLTTLYRKEKREVLENPFTHMMKIQGNGVISKIQAMNILREHLQTLELEGKNTIIIQVADNLSINRVDKAFLILDKSAIPNKMIDQIKKTINDIVNQKQSATIEKASLWDKLCHAFENAEIKDKNEWLRNVVNKGVDEKRVLEVVLDAVSLTFSRKRKASTVFAEESSTMGMPHRASKSMKRSPSFVSIH